LFTIKHKNHCVIEGHCGISLAPAIDRDFFNSYMAAIEVEKYGAWITFNLNWVNSPTLGAALIF
jgi:hypothetical protein